VRYGEHIHLCSAIPTCLFGCSWVDSHPTCTWCVHFKLFFHVPNCTFLLPTTIPLHFYHPLRWDITFLHLPRTYIPCASSIRWYHVNQRNTPSMVTWRLTTSSIAHVLIMFIQVEIIGCTFHFPHGAPQHISPPSGQWTGRTNQPIREITNHSREIYGIYSKLIMENRKIATWTRFDLETLGFWLIMSKNLPGHCSRMRHCPLLCSTNVHFRMHFHISWVYIDHSPVTSCV
jgi:hypothetical protein